MSIGNTLSGLLKARGLNPNKLSIASGVNVNTIYGIIRRDNRKVDLSDLQAICDALGVTLDYFAERDRSGLDDFSVSETGKPAAPDLEQPVSELVQRIARKIVSLPPKDMERMMDYLALLERSDGAQNQ